MFGDGVHPFGWVLVLFVRVAGVSLVVRPVAYGNVANLLLAITGGVAALASANWDGDLIQAVLIPDILRTTPALSGRVAAQAGLSTLCSWGLARSSPPSGHPLHHVKLERKGLGRDAITGSPQRDGVGARAGGVGHPDLQPRVASRHGIRGHVDGHTGGSPVEREADRAGYAVVPHDGHVDRRTIALSQSDGGHRSR